MGNIYGNSHISKMESVAEPDQRHCDDMMQEEFLEILPRLFKHKDHDNRLLRPVAGLQEVIRFDNAFVSGMRESLEHALCAEVPYWRSRHHVHSERAKYAEIDCRVVLLHEARLPRPRSDTGTYRDGSDYPLHDKLAREGENDRVKCHEREVIATFTKQDSV